jgi:hypothetical protein
MGSAFYVGENGRPARLLRISRLAFAISIERSVSLIGPSSGAAAAALRPQVRSRPARDRSHGRGPVYRGRRRRQSGGRQGMDSAADDRCASRRRGQRRSGNISKMCRSAHRDAAPAARRSSPARQDGDSPLGINGHLFAGSARSFAGTGDPAGWQMSLSVARKLQAMRTLLYPTLQIERTSAEDRGGDQAAAAA